MKTPAVAMLEQLIQWRTEMAAKYGLMGGGIGEAWVKSLQYALRRVKQAEYKARRAARLTADSEDGRG